MPPSGAAFAKWDRATPPPAELVQLRPDAVIDVTSIPAYAESAVALWPKAHWIYISTVSVYSDLSRPGGTVLDTPLLPPLNDGDPRVNPDDYGSMKVACENYVRQGTASSLILRPGLIVGPRDRSGRFAYWPSHAAAAAIDGDGLLVPGQPADPVQFIDVGDLSRWVVRTLDDRMEGCFDAIGPSMSWADFMTGLGHGVGAHIQPVYASPEWLTNHGVVEWVGQRSLPLWVAGLASAGMLARDATAALGTGLVTRPIADTVSDTLAWLSSTPDAPVTGLTRAEERALLEALR